MAGLRPVVAPCFQRTSSDIEYSFPRICADFRTLIYAEGIYILRESAGEIYSSLPGMVFAGLSGIIEKMAFGANRNTFFDFWLPRNLL